jgi:hypothetical protein
MNDINNKRGVNPSEWITSVSTRWYVLTALMIIGGLVGFLLAGTFQPLYEASATFSVTIDYTRTGALSDIQEDQAMRGVGSVIFSDSVIQSVFAELDNINGPIPPQKFYERASLDRTDFRWTLRFRDEDPRAARQTVGIWADHAERVISTGLEHALALDSYYLVLDGYTYCLQRGPAEGGEGDISGFESSGRLLEEIASLSQLIQREKEASMGLFSHLSVALVEGPTEPAQEVRYGRGSLVFSGSMIGLLAGVIGTSLEFLLKKEHHS